MNIATRTSKLRTAIANPAKEAGFRTQPGASKRPKVIGKGGRKLRAGRFYIRSIIEIHDVSPLSKSLRGLSRGTIKGRGDASGADVEMSKLSLISTI